MATAKDYQKLLKEHEKLKEISEKLCHAHMIKDITVLNQWMAHLREAIRFEWKG